MTLYSYKNNKRNSYLYLSPNLSRIKKKEHTRLFTLKPCLIYNDSLLNKSNALRKNINKSGIYRWVNNINNKSYIGSSINIYSRLKCYYSNNYLKNELKVKNSHIYRALLYYGHDKFKIEVLEYCSKELLTSKEQYYIDLLKPEYNILKTAGSTLGFKHSPEALLKFKTRKLSSQAKKVVVIHRNTGITIEFLSIRRASLYICKNSSYISKCLKKHKFYKNIKYILYYNKI